MARTGRVGDLEIVENVAFEKRTWIFQRIGWLVMLGLLIAALLGVFGSGLLSNAQRGKPGDPFYIEYQRFGRMRVEEYVRVHVANSLVQNGKLQLWFDRDYLRNRVVTQTIPEADTSDVSADRVTYTFDVADTTQPVEVTFVISPDAIGGRTGQVGVEGGPDYHFDQFVYP